MKNLKNLGKALNKNEQKEVFGGRPIGFICNPEGPIVVCPIKDMCHQDANGNWYCA